MPKAKPKTTRKAKRTVAPETTTKAVPPSPQQTEPPTHHRDAIKAHLEKAAIGARFIIDREMVRPGWTIVQDRGDGTVMIEKVA